MQPSARYYQRLLAGDEREAGKVLEDYLKEKPLEDLYDAVLIPALSMAEQGRHANVLDDATVAFINQTTKELVEELGLQSDADAALPAELEADSETHPSSAARIVDASSTPLRKILCVPSRDDADEIIAVMLAQLLERAGYPAQAASIGSLNEMVAEVSKEKPDAVYLSALPPYAMSHARHVYRILRGRQPQLAIIIGLWNYAGDPLKAAAKISGGEQDKLWTTLAQAVSQHAATLSLAEASVFRHPKRSN